MVRRMEKIINYAEDTTDRGSAVDGLVTEINSNSQRFELVNERVQLGAALVSAVPILAPISLQANTLAGTTSFLKIVVDIQEGGDFEWGDAFSLVGATVGIIATGAMLAGATTVGLAASGVAVVVGAAALYDSENVEKLTNWTRDMVSDFWPESPVPSTTSGLHLDSEGNFRNYQEIMDDPDGTFGAIRVSASSWGAPESIVPMEKPADDGGEYTYNPM